MKKVFLTATGGGHLAQIRQLDQLKSEYEVAYVIAKNNVNRKGENVFLIPRYRTKTKYLKFFDLSRSFIVSFFLLLRERPDVVISTGAAATYPICWLQKKIFKKKVIFIESFARKTSGSKTGLMVYKFADSFVVQRKELLSVYPNAIYGGMIY